MIKSLRVFHGTALCAKEMTLSGRVAQSFTDVSPAPVALAEPPATRASLDNSMFDCVLRDPLEKQILWIQSLMHIPVAIGT